VKSRDETASDKSDSQPLRVHESGVSFELKSSPSGISPALKFRRGEQQADYLTGAAARVAPVGRRASPGRRYARLRLRRLLSERVKNLEASKTERSVASAGKRELNRIRPPVEQIIP
jgi:hypothetical protein